MLDDAERLEDMAAVPGNRLEVLGGDRKGQHSIRINDQWRLCFIWREGAAESVEIVDYHSRGDTRMEDRLGKAVRRDVLPRTA